MTEETDKPGFDDVESRRSPISSREMTLGRRLYYAIGMPVVYGILRLLWWSWRVEKVIGADIDERVVTDGKTYAPCYWHQHSIVILKSMRDWIRRGFKAGFIVSASVDGEVPAKIARSWGAEVIRGSAQRTGALAMRDIHQVMKNGYSIVTAADGPLGPCYEFKPGVVLMAKIGSAPMIPIGCAADKAWYLKRWDNFIIPKPFARIVLAVGEPLAVPRAASMEDLEDHRLSMQNAILRLMKEAERALH